MKNRLSAAGEEKKVQEPKGTWMMEIWEREKARTRANMKKRGWLLVKFVRKDGDVDYSAARVVVLSKSR